MPERPRTINRIAAGAASGAMGTVALNAATFTEITDGAGGPTPPLALDRADRRLAEIRTGVGQRP